jgi:translation initiation factor IF-1
MVKNISGGSKSKKMASKDFKNKLNNHKLRTSNNELEIYSIITEKLGGSHIRAVGIDGKNYMVHIGGKFRNERINKYDFILLGIRDWQSPVDTTSKKTIMTDLLEIYNEQEKMKLLKINGLNWNVLLQNDNQLIMKNDGDEIFEFSNETESEYKNILEKEIIQQFNERHFVSIKNATLSIKNNKDTCVDDDFIDFETI